MIPGVPVNLALAGAVVAWGVSGRADLALPASSLLPQPARRSNDSGAA
jgi:hypothetical protein